MSRFDGIVIDREGNPWKVYPRKGRELCARSLPFHKPYGPDAPLRCECDRPSGGTIATYRMSLRKTEGGA